MFVSTDRLSRTATRLAHANRRVVAQDGRRVPARLYSTFDRLRDLDILSGSTVQHGSLLEAKAPARA